ncbi:MAG: nitronate monooxygenase family protein [Candidatus Shapirobacteria bacterium]|jgi:nitronate monooxygenase
MNNELPPLRIGKIESRYPIVLGGMSTGLTTKEMASAVANEGGCGTIGGVGLGISPRIKRAEDYLEANELCLKREICNALEMTNNGNVGVNLMVATTDYENSIRVAVESGAKFIVSGAGLPTSLPKYVDKYKRSGQETPALIPIVSSLRATDIILRKWGNYSLPAAFVVETPNTAGGHLGAHVEDIGTREFSLEVVVPQLVEFLKAKKYDIPVIAAGGIWDRTDIDHMLDIGASGVQMATRFLVTKECNASEEFKARHLLKNNIVIIKSPVGMPGRAIENDFIIKVNSGERFNLGTCVKCLRGCEYSENGIGYCIIRALHNAHIGDIEKGVLFTGTNGYRLKESGNGSVKEIFNKLTGK